MRSETNGLVDAHCHVDMYPDPEGIAREADRQRIATIAVTNLPSHYRLLSAHLKNYRSVHPALGLHPLLAERHGAERSDFQKLAGKARFIGEVGLDHSEAGKGTEHEQQVSFRVVLESINKCPRFVTVHSRGAEPLVLDLLSEYQVTPVVLHWYSGSIACLDRAVEMGHYFSVNPAMIRNAKGKALISRMPKERVLTESDGPYCQVGRQAARPWDVSMVLAGLSILWDMPSPSVIQQVHCNAVALMSFSHSVP